MVCIYCLDAIGETSGMKHLKPKKVTLCFRCMICGTQLLVPVEWNENHRLTMTLTCTTNCCNQKLNLKSIKPARFECTKDSPVVFSIEGEWKIKKFYLDDEVKWCAKINGEIEMREFTTKNGGDWELSDWDEEEKGDMEPKHEPDFYSDSDTDSDASSDMMARHYEPVKRFRNFKWMDYDYDVWWEKTDSELIRNLLPVDSRSRREIDMMDFNTSMENDLHVPNKKKLFLRVIMAKVEKLFLLVNIVEYPMQ